MSESSTRLTQYSYGAGCGCKTSSEVLEAILHSGQTKFIDPDLLVGGGTHDDTTVYDLGSGTSAISTIGFFVPVVGSPFDSGHITVTNAISDTSAMDGKPIVAIAILGWPISKPSPGVAREVTEGGRYARCQAGIALAGDRSINAPEPIFGLVVMETVPTERVKENSTVQAGCKLFLTRSLGIGTLTTVEKKSLPKPEHQGLVTEVMCRMNIAGASFTNIEGVKTMTDVTGFGLLSHLSEICQGVDVQACVNYGVILELSGAGEHIELGAVPDGTEHNLTSYGYLMGEMSREVRGLLCNPQTFGGLLLAVTPKAENEVKAIAAESGVELSAIGGLASARGGRAMVEVH